MKNEMMVSLILTTFNCKEYLMQTLDNIDMQTYSNIEVVIKDGESTDGTLEIIKNYADSRQNVIWCSKKDCGIYDAMNKGYALSKGDVIAFFNDKFNSNDTIQKIVDVLENSSADCMGVHGDLVYEKDGKIIRNWKMGEGTIQSGWMLAHPTMFLKREIYEQYGLYDTSYTCSADYEYMVRILKDRTNMLAYIPEVLVRMYYGGTSTQGLKAYWVSFVESYRALKKNKVSFPLVIMAKRIIRFVIQFKN